MDTIHLLMQFGLTHQEAKIYEALHSEPPLTGYEIAKMTGISRSNVYAGLSNLVEKGGVHMIDGKPVHYETVPVNEFCRNVIRNLEKSRSLLEDMLAGREKQDYAYLTVKGSRNVRDKIETVLLQTEKWVYVSMKEEILRGFLPQLCALAGEGKKVVVLSDAAIEIPGGTVYRNREQPGHIRLISDTSKALTGSLDDSVYCTCVYSENENLVNLLRDSMKNEIRLIELSGGK